MGKACEEGQGVERIHMCQINSGMFSVPWEKSRKVIEELEVEVGMDIPREVFVYSLPRGR